MAGSRKTDAEGAVIRRGRRDVLSEISDNATAQETGGSGLLKLEKDLFAVEEVVREEAEGNEGQGEGEGRDVGGAMAGEEVFVGPEPGGDGFDDSGGAGCGVAVGHLDPEGDLHEKIRDDEGGNGVGAEDEPGPEEGFADAAFVGTAHVYEPVAEDEQDEGAGGGEEDVGAGPEVLIDGEAEIPGASNHLAEERPGNEAGEGLHREARRGWPCGRWGGRVEGRIGQRRTAQPEGRQAADEGSGDSGKGAKKAFGVTGVLVKGSSVEEVPGEGGDGTIEPGG